MGCCLRQLFRVVEFLFETADFHHACLTVRRAEEMDAAIAAAEARDWPHARYLSWFYQDHCLDPRL
jgi:hypothetical protein